MDYERDQHGVKIRGDGRGDAWARSHRQLGQNYHMLDFDGWHVRESNLERSDNTEDHLFCEVVVDDQKRRLVRTVNYIALFDRKLTRSVVYDSWFTHAVYLNMCRRFSQGQSVPCRFIYVIGGQQPPWVLIESDIDSGKFGESISLDGTRHAWINIWRAIGLTGTREIFEHELKTYRKELL